MEREPRTESQTAVEDPPAQPAEQRADGAPPQAPGEASNGAQAQAKKPQILLSRTPQLAPDVELSGEMKESAFKDPPYLIQRDGQYIQTPELLYRIAEQIDGTRTVDEIAQRASEATKIAISPEELTQLLAKLFTMGVITDSEGKVVTETAAPAMADGYSPLALNMRMAMIGPKLLRPVATVLRVFHWPPVLLALLLAAIGAHWWLYFVHGIGGGMHQAFYAPGLLLALIGLIVVSAIFHEFGHASALEYGGGKVKTMGVGLYMIYPAFYTDVTDSYRLKRWGRVRTDLGGLYFNLLFSLLLIGIFWLTGAEFLLLGVALVNFETLHQLFPLGRLDGYWALADLIGMPDFFSRMGPFLRSVLPRWVPLPEGQKLPAIKTHAKVVFAAYILLSVPLLLFLLFLMLRAAPRIIATGVDSFIAQTSVLEDAAAAGSPLEMAGTIVQMAILVMVTGGVFYMLFNIGKKIAMLIWNWSKPSAPRKVVGALGGLLAVLFLAFLWAPQLPLPGAPAGPAYQAASFEPIREGERFTVGDAAAQRVVVRDPATGTFREIDPATDPIGERDTDASQDATPAGGQSSGQDGGQSPGSGSNQDSTGPNDSAPGSSQQDPDPTASPNSGSNNNAPSATPRSTPDASPEPSPEATLDATATPLP